MATEKQKTEALFRMKQLTEAFNLNKNLHKYLKEDRLYYSYIVSGILGCIDTIEYDKNYAKICREFEEEHHAYVYHAIESNSIYGKMLSLLYVSSKEDEWEFERLEQDYISAYVYNLSEDFGEFGDIFLMSDNGALLRKA